MTTDTPKSPLRQLADIMSEHRSLIEMQQGDTEDAQEYAAMDQELASRALHIIDTAGLEDLSNPLISSAKRFVSAYAKSQVLLRSSYPTDREVADGYKSGSLYLNLSPRSKELVDKLMIDLTDTETLGDIGTVVRTPKEAADALGLKESDVERAYGLLTDVEEHLDEGDTLEFMAMSFDRPERIPRIIDQNDETDADTSETDEATPFNDISYELSDRYVARVRKNDSGQVISLVMDAVPTAENNAAYILRNDDGAIDDVSSAVATKRSARANGARRVLHTRSGESGTVRRINSLLAVPLETFRDPAYRPR